MTRFAGLVSETGEGRGQILPFACAERLQESAPDDTYEEWGLDEDVGEEEGRR